MTDNKSMKTVAVLGAGASGHAIAGFLGLAGYKVNIWNRNEQDEVQNWLQPLQAQQSINVHGIMEGDAPLNLVTTDISDAIHDADVMLVNTTVDAYKSLAAQLAPYLSSSQVVILLAAGTLGSVEFWTGLTQAGFTDDLVIGETSTTVFGSRITGPAQVRIGGRKQGVELSTLPHGNAQKLGKLIPEFNFVEGDDILWSGLNNVGPVLHVVPMTLNAGRIESEGGNFLYYVDGITPSVAEALERFDDERMRIAEAFGYNVTSIQDYLHNTVAAPQGTVYESIQGCAMYSTTPSPSVLDHRFLWEDTMAGVVPFLSLAKVANVPVPITEALATLASTLLSRDLVLEGRNLNSLGLEDATVNSLKDLAAGGDTFITWKNNRISELATN